MKSAMLAISTSAIGEVDGASRTVWMAGRYSSAMDALWLLYM